MRGFATGYSHEGDRMPSPEVGSCPASNAAPTRSRRDACDLTRPSDDTARVQGPGRGQPGQAAAQVEKRMEEGHQREHVPDRSQDRVF